MPFSLNEGFSPCKRLTFWRANPDEETTNWRAVCGRTARTVVCPAKAGMFNGRQSRQGKNQKPCNLDGRYKGNRLSEAHRQSNPLGM
jgi:hypothetical protein